MAGFTTLRNVRRQDPVCNTDSNPWMLNDSKLNPCQLVERIMGICAGGPLVLGPVSGNLSCPLMGGSNCCCSVATYALMSACWVCQGNEASNITTEIQPSYEEFFQNSLCPQPDLLFPDGIQNEVNALKVPSWAFIRPNHFSDHWNFGDAQANGTASMNGSQPFPPTISTSASLNTPTSVSTQAASNPSSLSFSKSSTPPGTIAGAVIGALALFALMCVGAWFFWRWRRRHVIRLRRGARVDLTEPEMQESTSRAIDLTSGTADPARQNSVFPFPYEGVVPRYHPNAQHSFVPSRSEEDPYISPDDRDVRPSRRHTAPLPLSYLAQPPPMDQFDEDLARLQGVAVSTTGQRPGEGKGQVHQPHKTPRRRASITTFTPSSNSGSTNSRRARRKSEEATKGRYFHLPPSAQYLANVARYPENVDPERPWNIRKDNGTS